MLEVNNLYKYYKKNTLEVLNNVNYKFEKGKFYCIIGKSGAGKSTFIQLLGLLEKPTSGEILFNGKDTTNMSFDECAYLRNNTIGFVFQSFYLDPLLKAYENVMLPKLCKKCNYNSTKEEAIKLLTSFGLEDRINHFPKELSGGEQQRVAIARAIINNPDIILADEPTGSLDPENEKTILKILKDLAKQNKCVIVVSHNLNTKKYADEIIKIDNKKISKVDY